MKLSVADILLIESYLKVGIRMPHIYGSFANNSGGYHIIGFRMKDIYNQIGRQKRQHSSDASGALKFLKKLSLTDPLMYVKHIVEEHGRLQRLFWSNGESQMNYKVFGDVLAFDATYKKIKYLCPFVIFSGVNHHNQTIVFATALVLNETEETYVWLLQQFMQVMEGKAPSSIITDGDLAMKNAISRVFPHAHHRLCAWHLLRNASSKVGYTDVMPYLQKCMLGDYDVSEFEEIWNEMVTKFGMEDNNWIIELYDRRKMWATAHIKGKFFAGLRMTSRCEALHCHIGKFVHSKITLVDFVEQFHRCLTYFCFRELETDFESNYGDVVLETILRSVERSASKQFTKEIFTMFRKVLMKTSLVRVVERQYMSMYYLYSVSKYHGDDKSWTVSFCPSPMEFRCSCLRMELIGLPCEHIVVVVLHLDFAELLDCLVLNRWSKTAKEAIRGTYTDCLFYWDSHLVARYANLLHLCKQLCELASRDDEDYNHVVDVLTHELNKLRVKYGMQGVVHNTNVTEDMHDTILDPPILRTKGCGSGTAKTGGRGRRNQRCSTCGQHGHNRQSCPTQRYNIETPDMASDCSLDVDDSGVPQYNNDIDSDMEQPETFIPSCSYPLDED